MFKKILIAQLVFLVLTLATTASAQISCEDNMLMAALEERLSFSKARHNGCIKGQKYIFDQDPMTYSNTQGTVRRMCNSVLTIYAKCEDTAARECQARDALSAAQNDCRNLQSDELELTKESVDNLNDLRPSDGGANILSKALTQDASDGLAGTSRTNLGSLDRITDEISETFSDIKGSFETGKENAQQRSLGLPTEVGSRSIGYDLKLSPEYQAILDGSVAALRQAHQDVDLGIEEAQAILNNGLEQIEDQTQRGVDQAREEIFENQTGSADPSDLSARMKRQFSEFQPPRPRKRKANSGENIGSRPMCRLTERQCNVNINVCFAGCKEPLPYGGTRAQRDKCAKCCRNSRNYSGICRL